MHTTKTAHACIIVATEVLPTPTPLHHPLLSPEVRDWVAFLHLAQNRAGAYMALTFQRSRTSSVHLIENLRNGSRWWSWGWRIAKNSGVFRQFVILLARRLYFLAFRLGPLFSPLLSSLFDFRILFHHHTTWYQCPRFEIICCSRWSERREVSPHMTKALSLALSSEGSPLSISLDF